MTQFINKQFKYLLTLKHKLCESSHSLCKINSTMLIGEKIRKLRELKGYDQHYMASVLGIDQSNYSRIESDTTSVSEDRLQKIANALNVTPDYIKRFDDKIVFENCSQGNFGAFNVQHYHLSENEKDTYEKLLSAKDDIIHLLREQLKKYE